MKVECLSMTARRREDTCPRPTSSYVFNPHQIVSDCIISFHDFTEIMQKAEQPACSESCTTGSSIFGWSVRSSPACCEFVRR